MTSPPVDAEESGDHPGRVLLVDDDPDLHAIFATVVRMESVVLVSATTGRDALDAVKSGGRFDLVVLDLWLPDLSGWELLDDLAALYCLPHELAVVVLSASGSEADRARAFALGASGYIAKPLTASEIRTRLIQPFCRRP